MKPIPEFEGLYWVHPDGYVWNGKHKLKTYVINSGYHCVKLQRLNVRKSVLVHRIVAQAFCSNPNSKREVNHINGNKTDNSANNLEWVTSKENKQHAYSTGLTTYNTPSLGLKIGKTTKYHNVSYDAARNRYIGSIRHNKKTWYQKRFKTAEEAALHVNWIIDELGLTNRQKNFI